VGVNINQISRSYRTGEIFRESEVDVCGESEAPAAQKNQISRSYRTGEIFRESEVGVCGESEAPAAQLPN
jgi:hypothetical protein